jgi:hypothetical protein
VHSGGNSEQQALSPFLHTRRLSKGTTQSIRKTDLVTIVNSVPYFAKEVDIGDSWTIISAPLGSVYLYDERPHPRVNLSPTFRCKEAR